MKKIFALVLAVLMLSCALAACSQPAPAAEEPKTEAPKTEEVKEEKPAEEKPAEEPEAAGEPIKVGLVTFLTGASAQAGIENERVCRMVIDKANAAGGINGRPIELIVYDDEMLPETSVKCVTRLVDADNVVALLGCHLSANVLAAVDITESANMLHLAGGTSALLTNAGYKNVYRTTVSSGFVDPTWVNVMCDDMGVKKVALISIENEYGQSGHETILKTLEEKHPDVELVADVTFQVTDTDFTAQINKVLSSEPDGVIVYSLTDNACMVIKQLRRMGWTGHIYGDVCIVQQDVLNIVGDDANGIIAGAAYVIPATPEEGANEKQVLMLQEYYDIYNEMPVYDSAFRYYDGANMLVEALKTATDVDDRQSVADAYGSIKGYEGIGGVFDYTDGSGDGLTAASMFMIQDGKIQAYDKSKLKVLD